MDYIGSDHYDPYRVYEKVIMSSLKVNTLKLLIRIVQIPITSEAYNAGTVLEPMSMRGITFMRVKVTSLSMMVSNTKLSMQQTPTTMFQVQHIMHGIELTPMNGSGLMSII